MTDDEVDAAQLVVLQELLASVTDAVTSAGTVLGVTETTVEAGSHVGESRETGGVTGHGTTSNDITELFTSTTPSDYHAGTQTPVDATTFTTRRTTQITATLATVLDTNPTPSLSVASQSAAVQSTHGPSHDAASTTSTVITPMHTSSIEHMEFPVATRTVTAATMDDITGGPTKAIQTISKNSSSDVDDDEDWETIATVFYRVGCNAADRLLLHFSCSILALARTRLSICVRELTGWKSAARSHTTRWYELC